MLRNSLRWIVAGGALVTLTFPILGAPVQIVAAENFYGGVARLIAGDQADVTSILTNPNQDPHEFTSSVSTAQLVANAQVVIYNGLNYDTWMDKLLGIRGRPERIIINVGDLSGYSPGANPHLWYDPQIMLKVADRLSQVLSRLNPSGAAGYRSRLQLFHASIQPVLQQICVLQARSHGVVVTATEPVFGYLARALGLHMLNEGFQWKIMNDTEPSVAELAAFEQSLTSGTAKILFYNNQVTDPTTDRLQKLARASGVPTIGVSETQPLGKSYVEWMETELQEVENALPKGGR